MSSAMTSGKLTLQTIKGLSNTYDVETVRRVNVRNSNLTNVDCISKCTALEELVLRDNKLEMISKDLFAGEICEHLRRLDISGNFLKTLNGFEKLKHLEVLLLEGNQIDDVDELDKLSGLKSLKILHLGRNPCTEHPSYYQIVRKKLPALLSIDGERVSLKDSVQEALYDDVKANEMSQFDVPESTPWFDDDGLTTGERGQKGDQKEDSKENSVLGKDFNAKLAVEEALTVAKAEFKAEIVDCEKLLDEVETTKK
eukprot:g999.t1